MNNFYGSKLNTVLLLILIVLMVIAIKVMWITKEKYLHPFGQNQEEVTPTQTTAQVTGNKDDLVSFSVMPGGKVSGVMKVTGAVKNNYFFEANIGVSILDANKKVLKQSNGTATTEWMSTGPVSFESTLDFTSLPKGPAYIQIQNDNPSDIRANDKFIFIPVVIE